jgi:C1A family cysteine protease
MSNKSQLHFRNYNWRPDKPDFRDKLYKPLTASSPLPSKVDLRPYCSPVFDQGNIGSCTGNALAGAYEFLELKELRDKTPGAEIFVPSSFYNASRLFIYYFERFLEGDVNQDAGAEIRDGIKVLNTYGVCEEIAWPYEENNLYSQPNNKAIVQAAAHKISTYQSLNHDNLKEVLNSGYPVAFGISVYESFESNQVAQTGMVPMPSSDEEMLGGHAVLIVGYDDSIVIGQSTGVYIVRNSWGRSWGLQGYFYLPYDYVNNPGLARDFWMMQK